jgi:hypothetical protein
VVAPRGRLVTGGTQEADAPLGTAAAGPGEEAPADMTEATG